MPAAAFDGTGEQPRYAKVTAGRDVTPNRKMSIGHKP